MRLTVSSSFVAYGGGLARSLVWCGVTTVVARTLFEMNETKIAGTEGVAHEHLPMRWLEIHFGVLR